MKVVQKMPSIHIPIQKPDGSMEWVWYMFLQWLAEQQNTPLEAGIGIEIADDKINNTGVLGAKVNNVSLAKDNDGNVNVSVATGDENGTISVNGEDIAVKGLGSAAYTESTAYDISGAAATAEQNAKDYADGLVFNYAEKDFSNITDAARNIANWSSNVSNCITEIPQDIKLELNNGTLRLKAGSKVYVPNGTGVFDTYTAANDITSNSFAGSVTRFVFVDINNNTIHAASAVFSGTTAPTLSGTGFWYDTTNNVIKRTTDSGATWTTGYSFPIAIVTSVNDVATSIDQVFNGFGYIGSSGFVLPGVKGLIPNGRNADGTIKNIEFEVSTVLVSVIEVIDRPQMYITTDGNGLYNSSVMKYNPDTNYNYNRTNGDIMMYCPVGIWTKTQGVISNFRQKSVYRAADYNDLDLLLNAMYPIGAIYIGTTSYCPMSYIMQGTTWALVSSGRALWTGDGTNATTTIAAGVPDLTGWISMRDSGAVNSNGAWNTKTGVFASNTGTFGYVQASVAGGWGPRNGNILFRASDVSSVYRSVTTVQPPAYVVNVWRRTA